ncbi:MULTISPECIES: hypothetical protein [unclassified Leifsonia]|uniref:hypothetical protein n=1 Tax=unclassified Leifsonia TaxID=2663824 RepID=UPI0009269448|nr:hypothetical protein [Leifsonia sp. 71-9]OJX75047.1 MAG: hypothetical protein BGO91_08040 [Leifsonia sp. 71-9]
MRKYVFNGAVLSAVMGLWTTIQSTRNGVRDWRVPLLWISAALSLAIAIGTVVEDSKDAAERESKPLGSRKGS